MKQNVRSPLPLLYLLAIFAAFPACGFAQVTDTPEARRLAVRRYLQLVPMKLVWEESIQEVAKNIPADQRPAFVAIMRQTDLSRLEAAAADSLARHLTLKEIQAFIAFMELPEGQSAMKKMKFYMADLMPRFAVGVEARCRESFKVTSQKPNKAPEPTPTAVTPRAMEMKMELKQWIAEWNEARVVPAAGVAHL